MQTHINLDESRSVLGSLRALFPERRVRFFEALRIAELQATRLHQVLAIEGDAVPSEAVSELPRIEVQYRDIPTSGMSYWNGTTWIIAINRWEPRTRQRFTLFHEFKHIVDHGRAKQLYATDEQAEQAADFFAGCALMSRGALKRAWAGLIQQPAVLARLFDVSPRAITVRLAQIGLTDSGERCERPAAPHRPRPGHYHRQRSTRPYETSEVLVA
ncbi:protein of unknown function [Jatrophihabitans endophyticus]|uniref:IrrE N-terminal-like domain-containing protein n=1 Tax=Jatrophihabitans endophyticus TaxID=1206085 RepID=A0A1M5RXI7_9ACTN|nr:ImmA/IrrE family metallo-endopeptidase [Jatrophihabitans endophyticus]SHH31077.1 protein of unknown function [Jatrophihabitans endophyticus]